jgi:hypothetical protein
MPGITAIFIAHFTQLSMTNEESFASNPKILQITVLVKVVNLNFIPSLIAIASILVFQPQSDVMVNEY